MPRARRVSRVGRVYRDAEPLFYGLRRLVHARHALRRLRGASPTCATPWDEHVRIEAIAALVILREIGCRRLSPPLRARIIAAAREAAALIEEANRIAANRAAVRQGS